MRKEVKIIDPQQDDEIMKDLQKVGERWAFMLGQLNMLAQIRNMMNIDDIDPFKEATNEE